MADLTTSIFAAPGDSSALNVANSINEGADFIIALTDAIDTIHANKVAIMFGTVGSLSFCVQRIAMKIQEKTAELQRLALANTP